MLLLTKILVMSMSDDPKKFAKQLLGKTVYAHAITHKTSEGTWDGAVELCFDYETLVAPGKFQNEPLARAFIQSMNEHAEQFSSPESIKRAYAEMDYVSHPGIVTEQEFDAWHTYILKKQ